MRWLGITWDTVQKELIEEKIDFTSVVTLPVNKITPCGSLRVANISHVDDKLKFTLLYDRYIRT